jgi:hypothetical protein
VPDLSQSAQAQHDSDNRDVADAWDLVAGSRACRLDADGIMQLLEQLGKPVGTYELRYILDKVRDHDDDNDYDDAAAAAAAQRPTEIKVCLRSFQAWWRQVMLEFRQWCVAEPSEPDRAGGAAAAAAAADTPAEAAAAAADRSTPWTAGEPTADVDSHAPQPAQAAAAAAAAAAAETEARQAAVARSRAEAERERWRRHIALKQANRISEHRGQQAAAAAHAEAKQVSPKG